MATNAPVTPGNRASQQQRDMMARYGGAVDAKGWTIRKAFTPQLNLNLGMDRRRINETQLAEFNADFNADFAIGEEI